MMWESYFWDETCMTLMSLTPESMKWNLEQLTSIILLEQLTSISSSILTPSLLKTYSLGPQVGTLWYDDEADWWSLEGWDSNTNLDLRQMDNNAKWTKSPDEDDLRIWQPAPGGVEERQIWFNTTEGPQKESYPVETAQYARKQTRLCMVVKNHVVYIGSYSILKAKTNHCQGEKPLSIYWKTRHSKFGIERLHWQPKKGKHGNNFQRKGNTETTSGKNPLKRKCPNEQYYSTRHKNSWDTTFKIGCHIVFDIQNTNGWAIQKESKTNTGVAPSDVPLKTYMHLS